MKIINGSFFVRLYLRILDFFSVKSRESAIGGRLKEDFQSSRILNTRVFSRVRELWTQSVIHRFFCAVLNMPFVLTRIIRQAALKHFDESVLLSAVTPKYFTLLFGLCAGALYCVPHRMFNNMYSLMMMAVLMIGFLVCVLAGHYQKFGIRRVSFFACAFGVAVIYSYVRSPDLALRPLLFYLTAFLAVILIQTLNNRNTLYYFISLMLAAVTVAGIYGCYQGVVGVPAVSSQLDWSVNTGIRGRVFSFFENPNNFGSILVMTIPLYFAMFFAAKTARHKFLIFCCALPPAGAMLLTYMRSGWGALAVALLIFFIAASPKIIPAIFIAGACALPILPASILDRALTVFRGGDSSTQFRETVRDTLMPITRRYWLSGTGLGTENVRMAIRNYYPEWELPTWAITAHAHNVYMQTLTEMGIYGTIALVGVMLSFFVFCIRSIKNNPREKYIVAAGFGSIVGMLIIGVVEHIWFYPRVMLMFWIIIGLTVAAGRLENEKK
ncbi:MAG: O-antigen ligase family protein [Oscillospiraceae bacterium]|nr:O-antigen ligase family protein [Oscillospiraceae bacterium]